MGYIDTATNYLTDRSIRFLKKALFVIFTILGLVIVDQVFSFSYYINTSDKIEQVNKINKAIQNPSLSNSEIRHLKSIRSEIINHKSLLEQDFISPFIISFEDGRTGLWHFLTASWFLLFLAMILPFIGLYHGKFDLETVLIVFMVFEPIVLFLAWGSAKLLGYVPLIWGSPLWNYFVNFAIGWVMVIIIKKVRDTMRQKKATK